MADAGIAPAQQARVLEALHSQKVSRRAVQNAACQRSGGENPYDAHELLERVSIVRFRSSSRRLALVAMCTLHRSIANVVV